MIGFGIEISFGCYQGQTIFQNELSLYKRHSDVYRTNFYRFYNTKSIRFSAGVLGFLLGLLMYVRDNDRGIYRHGEEYGSARFATTTERRIKAEGSIGSLDSIYGLTGR